MKQRIVFHVATPLSYGHWPFRLEALCPRLSTGLPLLAPTISFDDDVYRKVTRGAANDLQRPYGFRWVGLRSNQSISHVRLH